MTDYSDLAKTLLPPLLAAFLSGYLVSRWKTREDAIEKRLDELIQQIDLVATEAVAYWLRPGIHPDTQLSGAKVAAGIAKLDGLRSTISTFLSATGNDEITTVAGHFFRETTGGDFGVHNRDADIIRALSIPRLAASYCVSVRRARMRDLAGYFRRK